MGNSHRGIAVYHEHREWFEPLFAELESRRVQFARVRPGDEILSPGRRDWPFEVVFNRMSPSAHLRGGAGAIRHTVEYLRHLESAGVRVINGSEAFSYEISKVRQLWLLDRLGLPYPSTRVVHDPVRLVDAGARLRYPLVVKPNVGGSGAGIARFDDPEQLADAVAAGAIDSSLDGTLLLQEFHAPQESRITRVEVLGGRTLYAIHVAASGRDFNLCPADLCRSEPVPVGEAMGAGPVDRPAEAAAPDVDLRLSVERIVAAAGMELGGVEYLESERDGRIYFYDINALSNFVADAPTVIGFDPFEPLVDFLAAELAAVRASRRWLTAV